MTGSQHSLTPALEGTMTVGQEGSAVLLDPTATRWPTEPNVAGKVRNSDHKDHLHNILLSSGFFIIAS